MPMMDCPDDHAKAGAPISYGASVVAAYRRAVYYVDRILKSTTPAAFGPDPHHAQRRGWN